jgi:hypothetical protein
MSAIPITISGFKPLQGLSGSAFGQFLSRLAGQLRKGQRKGGRHRKALTSFTSPEQGLSSIGQAAATCDIAPSQLDDLRLSLRAIHLARFADLKEAIVVVRSAIVVGMAILLVTVSLAGCGKSTTTTTAQKQQQTFTLQQPTFKAQPAMQQQPRQPIQQPTQVNPTQQWQQYPTTQQPTQMDIVYITQFGKRYHRDGCRCLQQSSIPYFPF